jgi:drug/metabolite transporter, DME family
MEKKAFYASLIVIAACLWGVIGVFSSELEADGFTSIQVTEVRCAVTAIGLLIVILIRDRSLFKFVPKDLLMFIAASAFFMAYNILYFQEIAIGCPLSMVSILLYTAPFFVLVLSVLIFKEELTVQKVLALIIAFIGCALAVGLVGGNDEINMTGLWMGIGSGVTYALYTIINKSLLKKYDPMTLTFYAFGISALCLLPFADVMGIFDIAVNVEGSIFWMLGLGVLITLIPYFLYGCGLRGLDAGYVSVLALIEPMVATVAGFLMYGQTPTAMKLCGIVLVIIGVAILNIRLNRPKRLQP